MTMPKRLCVYCGSKKGDNPIYAETAFVLGQTLAKNNITLVYGGASVGLMGVIADSVLKHGGEVIGVIPKFLADVEIAHNQLTTLHIVNTMHERKALMAELADGFITMPGGTGSLEELFEIWTLAQLNPNGKPCAVLNVNHYYDHLLKFLDHAVTSEFIKDDYRDMLLVDDSPEKLLEKIIGYKSNIVAKWIGVKEAENAIL